MTRKQRTARVLIAGLAATMLVATACTPAGPITSPSSTPAATEQIQQGGRIIEGTISDIATMQPILVADTSSARVVNLIYDNILIQDAKNGEPTPRMATFSASADGLTYTFEMNAKANWSDGKPVIAQDFLTAVMAVGKSGKTVRKGNYSDVQGFNEYCGPAGSGKWTVKMTRVSCPAILDLNTIAPMPTQVFGKYLTAASKPEDIDTAPENTNPTV